MYKLLIVDDEQMIVDWLCRLFGGLTQLELDIYKAYTGEQALSWLNRTKIDIVLTDIHMPEMNGIQLLDHIKIRWPGCKVIFLTGYDQFDYVYAAIKHDGVSYLLKTEDDSEIIKTVEKAIGEIENSYRNTELISRARQQVSKAMPLLQKEYLTTLLRGEKSVLPVTQQQLDEMEISLNADLPVIMLLGTMDNLSKKLALAEKNRLIYTAKNIVEAYLSENIRSSYIFYEESYSVWLIQSADPRITWERTSLFIKETLETAQKACMESLQVSMSFALAKDLSSWDTVSERYYGLRQLLNYRIGSKSGIILRENEPVTVVQDQSQGTNRYEGKIYAYLNKISKLESCLERGQKRDFFDIYSEIGEFLSKIHSMHDIPALEIYFSLSLKLLSYINRRGLVAEQVFHSSLSKLTRIDEFDCWTDAVDYLHLIAKDIFKLQERDQEKREEDIIMLVQQYIFEHLSEDISLVKLGELTYFNPSYLSRLFKQITGTNISDHIQLARINKAKELLGGTGMKIHEVSLAIGFDSPAYFAKFFKKSTGMTPQEYRDSTIMK
ncbi:response regulator transcription factor [Cohnella nanjingensis]|uniref:Response regulator n=1 Tax=Cohnella nanjingensis TaxID=1387779 RepID=A0A7X0RMB9_9BACL|nr:response regulator [Cohnella nanjingensis]MBB6670112.1 response regulator [Cohnella nanjingensis]